MTDGVVESIVHKQQLPSSLANNHDSPRQTKPNHPNHTGVAVAADGPDGAATDADNKSYAARLAARDASGRAAAGKTQTPAPLLKHREVQSGGGTSAEAGCQASGAGIADAYAALEARGEEEDDPLLGSVLPSGGAVATGGCGCVFGVWACVWGLGFGWLCGR